MESLRRKLKELLASSPLESCLPSYPWEGDSWDEVVALVANFVNSNQEVLDEDDPFVEWFEKYQFVKTRYRNQL